MNTKFDNISYSDFVGLVQERNRPSGGIKTVHSVAVNAFIKESTNILEIGSNTGFASVNLSLLTNCSVTGIDINKASVLEARKYATECGVGKRVKFKLANTTKLPFKDSSFDIVWCSNVTSFVKNKHKAIAEYLRVLKKQGYLVAVPIYYNNNPPINIVRNISKAIGNEIDVMSKNDWVKLFKNVALDSGYPLELCYSDNNSYCDCNNNIESYVDYILQKDCMNKFTKRQKEKINKKALYFYNLFNKNLKYAGYSILLFQKRCTQEEIELFITKRNEKIN
jgi:ubiquinone/menaquinone biosynthesis C-methylase UbiE